MYQNKSCGPYKYDDDEDYVPTKKVKYSSKDDDKSVTYVKKHTLDSDEEENEDAQGKSYDILKDEDIDGQEDGTIDFEGETRIMPFNMKEEMQEGHFDQDGFYHFKKENEHLKDAWLDNIDWIKVKHNKSGSELEENEANNSIEEESELNTIAVYEEMLPFLKKGETIAKALKRFGGGTKRLSSSERWKLKKQGKLTSISSSAGSDMESFTKITELANKILLTGNMDVYEETYEMIKLKIERSKAPKAVTQQASYDMFADETSTTTVQEKEEGHSKFSEEKDSFEELKWLYRWENCEEADTHGPFNTQQMLKWQQSGFFQKGAYVRKTTDTRGNWYHSARIDFDIYI